MEIVWLPAGRRTLLAQLAYIARDNPGAAACVDEEIFRQIRQLRDHPERGRPGRQNRTRELVITRTPFIAVYRVVATRIEVIRILHGAQQWPRARRPTP